MLYARIIPLCELCRFMSSGNYRDRFGGLGPFGAVTASAVAGVLRGLRGWANDG